MQSTVTTPTMKSSPVGRKKPHCRSCGLPMEGHRKGECYGVTERSESNGQDDSDIENGSDGEMPDMARLKTPGPSPFRVTRASSRVTQNQKDAPETSSVDVSVGEDDAPTVDLSPGTSRRKKTSSIPNLKGLSASNAGNVSIESDALTNGKHASISADEEKKPIFTTFEMTPSLNADTHRSFLAAEHTDVNLPSPRALIYASSDFLELGEAGAALRDRILKNVEGKDHHTAIFYTPTPLPDGKSYEHKEWLVVGQGEGSEALVKHIVRLADSQSVLRSRAPGSFIVGGELEIVEGPRIVTIPQLVFGSFVAVVLLMYVLSIL